MGSNSKGWKAFFVAAVLVVCAPGTVGAQDVDWPQTTAQMRPGSRWWWLGNDVNEKDVTTLLEAYAAGGMGTMEIAPIYGVQGRDAFEIPYLSPRWMDVYTHTVATGKRLDMSVDLTNGTGWPFGGPWISVADAATKAIFQQMTVQGGKTVVQEVAVQEKNQQAVATLSRLMAYSADGTQVLDVTDKVQGKTLRWKAPQGTWNLVALFEGKTLQQVKRAAPGGEGYVMDHLSATAVAHYLKAFDQAFARSEAPFPATFFNDSYEVYGADWTPGLLEAFAARRGYRLEDHFPAFIDPQRPPETCRLVTDYRQTVAELLLENFTQPWTDWAHGHGALTRNQAHGSPGNLIDLYAAVDIPECEGFGLSSFHIQGLRQDSLVRRNDSDLSMLKYASSAAHITGKPLVSSESFTWLTEHFRASLSQCKPDLDLLFVSGVNHVYFHGTPYSPPDTPWPGRQFYASVNFSPTNPFWRDFSAFSAYITRCQSFLQMGQPDNDILLYLPIYDMWNEQPGRLLAFTIHEMQERAPAFIASVNQILAQGYDVDYISDRYLLGTRYENGKLVTSSGTTYKALVLPAVTCMPHDVLAHVLALKQQGATVVFTEHYPSDVPGNGRREARLQALNDMVNQLPRWRPEALRVPAEDMKARFGLSFIRRKNDSGYHYFIASLQDKGVDQWVTLTVPARDAVLFDPMTGRKGLAPLRQVGGKTQVFLSIPSGGSLILQTFDKALAHKPAPFEMIGTTLYTLPVDKGWQLSFPESTPAIEGTFHIDTLCPWTDLPVAAARTNSGTALYRTVITVPAVDGAQDWVLDLGDVRESARVRVNGHEAGTLWAVPFTLRVGAWLHEGPNTLEVEVTNLGANRIAQMDRDGTPWRVFKEINVVDLHYKATGYGHWEPMPAGLHSSVRLTAITNREPSTSIEPAYDFSVLQQEYLGRGAVAVRSSREEVFVSWRLLPSDPEGVGFDVYRNGKKLNRQPLTGATCWRDHYKGTKEVQYRVVPVGAGVTATSGQTPAVPEGTCLLPAKAPMGYIEWALDVPPDGVTPSGQAYSYAPNDASVGDVDGDGTFEIILKWDPSNAHDNAHNGYTGPVLFDCYRLTGEKLWRINLGRNIRAGAHYTQFMVFDFDGDNRAELVMKTSDGTVDGTGTVIGDAAADYRNANGHIDRGNEYLTVFEGLTGRAMQTIDYVPQRGKSEYWGDNESNRSERYLAAVAYLDGRHPSVVMCRGYYTRAVLAAFSWDGEKLTQDWIFDSNQPGLGDYAGQGNHNLRVGDVDGDGCDEIIYGQCAIDNDGTGLYSTRMGHGDAMHLTKFNPHWEGLQVWSCHENRRDGTTLRSALTGEILFQVPSPTDVGRCMAADIDPLHPGVEVWSWDSNGLRSSYDGSVIVDSLASFSVNMGVWWDGDLLRELLDKNYVSKYNWETGVCDTLYVFEGCVSNNGTKATPCVQGDLLGDWREEVLLRTADNTHLRLYVSTIDTQTRFPTFLADPPYRISIATQNVAYNQPTQPGFYFGPDK